MCTTSRSKKVVVSLILVATTLTALIYVSMIVGTYTYINIIVSILLVIIYGVLPAAVLVVNLIVVREVRRSSHYAATNLGLQQHHQSTSSNSAVPTVTLVTTSLVYVAIYGTWSMFTVVFMWIDPVAVHVALRHIFHVAAAALPLVYAYNFYVYLITSKLFRSELHKLLCYCFPSSAPAAPAPAPAVADAGIATVRILADTAI